MRWQWSGKLMVMAALWLIGHAAWVSAVSAADIRSAFSAALARKALHVGVPYLAPLPVAGAKIRTPDGLDVLIAEKLAQRLGIPLVLTQLSAEQALTALQTGQVDVVLSDRAALASTPAAALAIQDTGYAVRPKAVIRSDTPLRAGAAARGYRVCMAEAALSAQVLATRWGAVVHTYRVPSDALVAVREGQCDLGLVDDALWEPLMRLPEWKKFSATLPPEGAAIERVWLLLPQQTAEQAWLASEMQAWKKTRAWQLMANQWARDVAFDVYLDQEVPDCHG